MRRIHSHLVSRHLWYRLWHEGRYHRHIHWGVLLAVFLIFLGLVSIDVRRIIRLSAQGMTYEMCANAPPGKSHTAEDQTKSHTPPPNQKLDDAINLTIIEGETLDFSFTHSNLKDNPSTAYLDFFITDPQGQDLVRYNVSQVSSIKSGSATDSPIAGKYIMEFIALCPSSYQYRTSVNVTVEQNSAPQATSLAYAEPSSGQTKYTLSWVFTDSNSSDTQSAYRLIVLKGQTTVLDTSKTTSSATSRLVELESGTSYELRVSVWDNHDLGSEGYASRSFTTSSSGGTGGTTGSGGQTTSTGGTSSTGSTSGSGSTGSTGSTTGSGSSSPTSKTGSSGQGQIAGSVEVGGSTGGTIKSTSKTDSKPKTGVSSGSSAKDSKGLVATSDSQEPSSLTETSPPISQGSVTADLTLKNGRVSGEILPFAIPTPQDQSDLKEGEDKTAVLTGMIEARLGQDGGLIGEFSGRLDSEEIEGEFSAQLGDDGSILNGRLILRKPSDQNFLLELSVVGQAISGIEEETSKKSGTFEVLVRKATLQLTALLAAVGLLSLPTVAGALSSNILTGLPPLRNLLPLGYVTRKKKKPFGTIRDRATELPVLGAIVQLIDLDKGRVVEQSTTDETGRFGFLAETGHFKIIVRHSHFKIFESQPIEVARENQRIALDVNLNQNQKASLASVRRAFRLQRLFDYLRALHWPLLIAGTLSAAYLFYSERSTRMILLGVVYLLFWLIELILLFQKRPFGKIATRQDQPVALALVRLLTKDDGRERLVGSTVSNKTGRFQFLSKEGSYSITTTKPGFSAQNLNFKVRKGEPLIEKRIVLEKEERLVGRPS